VIGYTCGEIDMTIEELRRALVEAVSEQPIDMESAHRNCDDLLLKYIGDPEVSRIYSETEFWYA
jgi:hypothetical protein